MSDHTPGPWKVVLGNDVTGYPTFSICGMSGKEKRDTRTLTANARLIAAAPQMLYALKGIAESSTELEDERLSWRSHQIERADWQAVLAAIAAADRPGGGRV